MAGNLGIKAKRYWWHKIPKQPDNPNAFWPNAVWVIKFFVIFVRNRPYGWDRIRLEREHKQWAKDQAIKRRFRPVAVATGGK